jgi:hypothetical protein
MARALLDINVLIAMLDQGHLLHRSASRWLERRLAQGGPPARSPMPIGSPLPCTMAAVL